MRDALIGFVFGVLGAIVVLRAQVSFSLWRFNRRLRKAAIARGWAVK